MEANLLSEANCLIFLQTSSSKITKRVNFDDCMSKGEKMHGLNFDSKKNIERERLISLRGRHRSIKVFHNCVTESISKGNKPSIKIGDLSVVKRLASKIIETVNIAIGLYNSLHRIFTQLEKLSSNQNINNQNIEETSFIYKLVYQRLKALTFPAKKYKDTIEKIAEVTKAKIRIVWEQLSLKDKQWNQRVKQRTRSRYEKNPILVKFHSTELTAQDMFKLDVLGYFFIRNKEYHSYCKNEITMTPIIAKRTLLSIFGQLKYFEQMHQRGELCQKWISPCHQQQLSELVTIISVIQVKYRMFNNSSRYGYCQTKDILEIHQFEFEKRMLKTQINRNSYRKEMFLLRFCQLAFQSIGSPFDSRTPLIKQQIIIKLSNIAKIPSLQPQQQQFLEIKHQYNILLPSLIQQYNKIKDEGNTNSQVVQFSNMSDLTWLYVNDDKMPIQMRFFSSYPSTRITIFPDHIMKKAFYHQAKQNYHFLASFIEATLLCSLINEEKIFVQRLNFSYNQLVRLKYPNDKSKLLKKDLQPLLILGLKKQGPQFISYHKRPIRYQEYCDLLKSILSKNGHKQFSLVLLQFSPSNKLPWQNFMDLYWYFRLQMNSSVYVSHCLKTIYAHLLFASIMKKYLLKTDLQPKDFYKIVEITAQNVIKMFSQQKYRLEDLNLEKVIKGQLK